VGTEVGDAGDAADTAPATSAGCVAASGEPAPVSADAPHAPPSGLVTAAVATGAVATGAGGRGAFRRARTAVPQALQKDALSISGLSQ
jgi:hypothetical protein